MIIEPKIKGFLCTTAHPTGCALDVAQQIQQGRSGGPIEKTPKRILIIGASGGYGLATRIVGAFGGGAETLGVFFERPALKGRTASPGWYKAAAFAEAAGKAGLYAKDFNGDAFSQDMKTAVIETIRADWGKVDMVVYSLAAPARTLASGETVRSVLKPIGEPFSGATIDFKTQELRSLALEPASEEEIAATVKVMGGEDWEDWIEQLSAADVLADDFLTTNYTYLGSEVTWPIYYHGTIGRAKEDLDRAAGAINEQLKRQGGRADVIVMKGLLTQAASAIPGMSVYLSLLFKAMKAVGTHEGCLEQVDRLFRTQLFNGNQRRDEAGRIRMDDWELAADIQEYVKTHWGKITPENLNQLADFTAYQQAFLNLHGFAIEGVDYAAEEDPEVGMALVFG